MAAASLYFHKKLKIVHFGKPIYFLFRIKGKKTNFNRKSKRKSRLFLEISNRMIIVGCYFSNNLISVFLK